jgi:hypothetical protein
MILNVALAIKPVLGNYMLRNMAETMYKLSQESKIQMKIQAGTWI